MAMSRQYTPPVNKYTGSYTEDADGDGVRMNAFGHDDADISFDPLSANRRFPGTADLVFAGPTRESIDVMVPDCIVPPASGSVRVDLRHHVSLSLGPALDIDMCRSPIWKRPCVRRLSPTRLDSSDDNIGRN